MFANMSRGWSMARASLAVLRSYPRMAVLPLISGAIFVLVLAVILASLMPQFGPLHNLTGGIWQKIDPDTSGPVWLFIAGFAVLYVLTAVAVFFNVALIDCALRFYAGEVPSVRTGLATATARLPQILGWALVAATVGIVLNGIQSVLKDKLGFIGDLIGGLLEFSWATVSYFVIPVLVTERLGPIAALRRSSAILRAKWGESLAGEARFGLLGLLFFLQAAALFALGYAIVSSHGASWMAGLGPLLMGLGVLYAIGTIVVLHTLNAIFQAGVYSYATSGRVPSALDPALVQGAFRSKA
jgi:hypothetical protein